MSTESSKGQQRREAMGRDPVWSLLRRFSGPAIISMTVASTYNLVDAIFVGRLGPEALAAMGVTFPLIMSFTAIASGTGIGITSLITRSLGADDRERADRTAATGISLCFILWGIIALATLPYLDNILRLLGAEGDVLPLAREYMSILITFMIFQYLAHIMSSIIRSDGFPVFSSSVAIASSLINIGLDPLLIFGIGPFPEMGIAGAATATVIAQGCGATVFLGFVIAGRTAYRFRPGLFFPDLSIIGGIYRVGIASIVRSVAQFIVMGVVNRTAASFGVLPLAAMGVLLRTIRFVQMPVLGLGQGMLPLLGYNYGAKKYDRIAEILTKTAAAGLIWTGVCWLIIMIIPTQVISAFNADPDFLEVGGPAIRIYAALLISMGIYLLPSFFFQGIGRGLPATLITGSRHLFFTLPAILILPHFLDVYGVWVTFPIADAGTLIFGMTWMFIEFRKTGIEIRWWRKP